MIRCPDNDEVSKTSLSSLKLRILEFKRSIEAHHQANESSKSIPIPAVVKNIENWSLDDDPIDWEPSHGSQLHISQPSAQVPPNPQDSTLDYFLSFLEDDTRGDYVNRTHVVESTRNPRQPSRDNHDFFFSPYDQGTTPRGRYSFGGGSNVAYTKKAQIHKWKLKFIGEPGTLPLGEFLRRVRELARSRGASKLDVFESAVELFDGSALSWYRAGMQSGKFRNWDDVETELKEDFRAYDYGDNMWEYIRSRLQKSNERIVTYFAIMEDLFLKLNRPANELVKVNTIRRNLRAEYIRALGVNQYLTLNELKHHCKCIESDLKRIQSRDSQSNLREPDAFPRHVMQSSGRVHVLSHATANQFDCDEYEQLPETQWDDNVKELSVREEPDRVRFDVPDANSFKRRNPFNVDRDVYYHEPNQNRNKNEDKNRYSAPLRNGNSQYRSENFQGSPSSRTRPTPTILRRP